MHKKTLVVDGITPVGAYQALRSQAEGGSFLLESVVPGERWGRYSILGYRPRSHTVIHGETGVDPFSRLSQLLPLGPEPDADVAERFCGAEVGLLAYDMVHYVTKVDTWPELENKSRPIARLIGRSTVVIFDNLTHTAVVASAEPSEVERTEALLASTKPLPLLRPPDTNAQPPDVEVNMSDAEYGKVVERAKEYIRAGDAFQIVPARTFSTPADNVDAFEVYRALRVLSPAPYMYLLELPARDGAPEIAIAGASPETLVRVQDGRITLRPIAGTRRRGRSAEEDRALAEEMLGDPKELAEHVMLIDLARNVVFCLEF
jgi:anthranilate synthase component 1